MFAARFEGDRIFSTDRARQLAPQVGLKDSYLLEALHHLRRTGWIVPLRRGLYALSSTVQGVTTAGKFESAMALVDPAAISHGSALHYHGLTEQAPRRVFVLTTTEASVPRTRGAKAGNARIGFPVCGTPCPFVQGKPERLFGTESRWIGEARVRITDPERTRLDGLNMPRYCGNFASVTPVSPRTWASRVGRGYLPQKILESTPRRKIIHGYGETLGAKLQVYALEEIVAEKLRAILQHVKMLETRGWSRLRARDYDDLRRGPGACRNQMDLADLSPFLREKCAVRNVTFKGPDGLFQDRILAQMETTWEPWLGPLVPGLPTFQVVIAELRPRIVALVRAG